MSRTRCHYIDKAGEPVTAAQYWDPKPFDGGVARVASPATGRVGLIDRSGEQVAEFRYDHIDAFCDGVARVNIGGVVHEGTIVGGQFGFITRDGNEVVECVYAKARRADEGRITVARDGRYGFLDLEGNVIVAPTYEFASWHSEGLAVVAVDGHDGFVDAAGTMVLEPRYEEATPFRDGIARVKRDGLWGLINRDGELIHDALYNRLGQIRDGACWAVQGDKCYVLAASGDVLAGRWFDEILQADEDGMWPVRDGEHWAFLRPDGSLVATGLDGAMAFTEGLGRARRGDKWGFVNNRGEWRIECKYADAWAFEEQRAAVRGELGWRFVDPDGQEYGPKTLPFGNRFRNGMAPVQMEGEWGFLGMNGEVSIKPQFSWVGYFADGLAAALDVDDETVPIAADRTDGHVLPPGGLTHPVFENADRNSHMIAVIGFGRSLEPVELARLNKLIAAWERGIHYTGKLYTEDKWVSAVNLYVRAQNMLDPLGAMSLLISELDAAELPITETLYSRWGQPVADKPMQPVADPRMPTNMQAVFDNFDQYWAAVWDTDAPPPVPENYFYLKGAKENPDGSLSLEERHTPIWFSDVRVCMGVLHGHGEQYLDSNDASLRVEDALVDAISHRFDDVWLRPDTKRRYPVPMTREGKPGVETVTYQGRTGYAAGFDYELLLHWFSKPRLRYREPELMEAIRLVVLALDLEPVILWTRFSDPIENTPLSRARMLVVNLFEKAD